MCCTKAGRVANYFQCRPRSVRRSVFVRSASWNSGNNLLRAPIACSIIVSPVCKLTRVALRTQIAGFTKLKCTYIKSICLFFRSYIHYTIVTLLRNLSILMDT